MNIHRPFVSQFQRARREALAMRRNARIIQRIERINARVRRRQYQQRGGR